MEALSLATLATLAGITLAVVLTMKLIKPLIWPDSNPNSPAAQDRFGGVVAVIVGEAWAIIAIIGLHLQTSAEIGQTLINGFLAGLAAVGLYTGAKRLTLPEAELPANIKAKARKGK